MSESINPITQIRSRLGNKANKTLFNNFISLFVLQMINYALPLIILPYLTHRLGPTNYGKIAWAQYAVQYLVILTDYGFNFSATRLISIHRNDKKKVNDIFSSVMIIKFILLAFSYLLLVLWMQYSSISIEEKELLNISFLIVAGSVLMPLWLFQGMESMKWITIVNVVFKTLLIIAIFIYVKEFDDIDITAWLMSGSNFLIGLFTLFIAFRQFNVKLTFPDTKELFIQFKAGWLVFLSTLFTAIYVTSNGFLLGELSGPTAVGYYTPAEKIVRAVTAFFNPVMLALYPFISKKFVEDRKAATVLFFKLLKQISIVTFIISVFVFIMAPLTDDFLGSEYSQSIDVIRWLAFIPFFGTAGALLSYHLFLNTGMEKVLPLILFFLAVADILLCYWLIPIYRQNGAAIALFIIEAAAPFVYLIIFYFYSTRSAKN